MIRPLLLALATTLVVGCASVPLATIVRMSTFNERDFVGLDPEVLRVRIRLGEQFRLNAARSWLGVELTSTAGSHDGRFELEQERTEPSSIPGGLFAADAPAITYTLRLSQASRPKFAALQAFVSRGKTEQLTLRVVPILASVAEDAATAEVWIELLLSARQGYFTLLDGAQVPMDAIRDASSGG